LCSALAHVSSAAVSQRSDRKAARLDRVLDGLQRATEDPKRRLPVVKPADAEAVCTLFHSQVDRGAEARAAFVERQGHAIACTAGCSDCCRQVPAVFAGEAITIARWLDRPEQAEAKQRFLARFPAWTAALADLLEQWLDAAIARDVAAAGAAHAAMYRRGVMCPFNHEGLCSIYEVRPSICRYAHALDTAEHCKPDATRWVPGAEFPPLDEYMDRIRPVTLALHGALRQDGVGAQPLPIAVHEQLTPPAPAPTR